MLGRVSEDRDDHGRDKEIREVGRIREGLQRADERFADEGGSDGRDAEHHQRGRQRPADGFGFGGPEELPLTA